MKKLTLFITTSLIFLHSLYAQKQSVVQENLWTAGKIYVVLAVVLIIFTGILFFLLNLEKRIRKLEKNEPK